MKNTFIPTAGIVCGTMVIKSEELMKMDTLFRTSCTLIARRINSVLKGRINDPHVRADLFQVTLTKLLKNTSFMQGIPESLLQKIINDVIATEIECLNYPNRKLRQFCASSLNQWESLDVDTKNPCYTKIYAVEVASSTVNLKYQLEAADALAFIDKYEPFLKDRQRKVLKHMKQGKTVSEIANVLDLTPTYIRIIQKELRAELAKLINS